MCTVRKLVEKIEEVRDVLNRMVLERENLNDSDIAFASERLDELLNKYYELQKEKK